MEMDLETLIFYQPLCIIREHQHIRLNYLTWRVAKCNKVKWSEVNEAKWSGMRRSEGENRGGGGGGRVFLEKVYRSSKWWEVKDWGRESVSELMIVKKNDYKKLYIVLSCLGAFTFCTCCKIIICLMCIVVVMCICCTVCALIFFFFYFRCRIAG